MLQRGPQYRTRFVKAVYRGQIADLPTDGDDQRLARDVTRNDGGRAAIHVQPGFRPKGLRLYAHGLLRLVNVTFPEWDGFCQVKITSGVLSVTSCKTRKVRRPT